MSETTENQAPSDAPKGDTVIIKSGGRFANTHVHVGGYDVPPGDLQKVQLYFEPGVDQVVCEVKFIKDGRFMRWVGVNQGDIFNYELNATDRSGTPYRIVSDGIGVEVMVDGKRCFPDGPKVLEIVANGWGMQTNCYFEQVALGGEVVHA